MTAAELRLIDRGLGAGISVLSASRETYCVRSRVGRATLYKRGPAGEITRTPCR